MEIVRNYVSGQAETLENFAERNNLTMILTERKEPSNPSLRFYARFEQAEVAEDGMLVGDYGDGATEDEAIGAYCREISGKRLVIGASTYHRREIMVPRLSRRKAGRRKRASR